MEKFAQEIRRIVVLINFQRGLLLIPPTIAYMLYSFPPSDPGLVLLLILS